MTRAPQLVKPQRENSLGLEKLTALLVPSEIGLGSQIFDGLNYLGPIEDFGIRGSGVIDPQAFETSESFGK